VSLTRSRKAILPLSWPTFVRQITYVYVYTANFKTIDENTKRKAPKAGWRINPPYSVLADANLPFWPFAVFDGDSPNLNSERASFCADKTFGCAVFYGSLFSLLSNY
jgi:hypothetical protein